MAKPSTSKSRQYRIKVPEGIGLSTAQFLELHRYLKLNRMLDARLANLYRQGKVVGGLYSSLGQEATSVGTAYALQDGDYYAPMIRNMGTTLVRGTTVKEWFAQYTGRVSAPTRGKDGNGHFGDLSKGYVAPISVLGALIPVIAGVALAMKQQDRKNVALTYTGDGSTSTTDFHEGLNFAAVHRVPFILVAENNLYAYSTHVSRQFPTKNITDRAPAYGIHGEIVDGNNVLACYAAAKRAREMCVGGRGPVLLEAKTFRRKGHAEHDPADYIPKKIRAEWEAKDPIDAYERFLLDEQIATPAELKETENKIDEELENAVQQVLDSPLPDVSVALEDVYAPDKMDGGHNNGT